MLSYNSAKLTPSVVAAGSPILISISITYEDFVFNKLDAKNITFGQLDVMSLDWPVFEGGDWDGESSNAN